MSLNNTPSSERIHIGFFGMRNAGKSSLVNAVTGQELAVVSDVPGTTTDPVSKAMELLPLGPVLIIDTPGIDDTGGLGELRVKKTRQILNKTDVAVLVTDITGSPSEPERELTELFKEKNIPYITVYNKSDLISEEQAAEALKHAEAGENSIIVSALKGKNIYELKELIGKVSKTDEPERTLLGDIVKPMDTVVLVIPIDSSAPKGRLILPQQQVIRELLETGAVTVCVKETELEGTLKKPGMDPALVITDSQAFKYVSSVVPEQVPLTSFSMLFARYKGGFEDAAAGAAAIDSLKDGDTVLMSEGCTHHRQCEDIGTVKIPNWIRQRTGADIKIETSSGTGFPEDLSPYSLIIHCGACMLNRREVQYRYKCAKDQNVPMTNYGIAIAHMNGILQRASAVFGKS